MDYSRYTSLNVSHRGPDNSVLDVQMKALNGKLPTAGHEGHADLEEIWLDITATARCAAPSSEARAWASRRAATWRWSRK